MTSDAAHDRWSAGQSYEQYMGRWSRPVAREFVTWLQQPAGLDWLDVGCGTGSLSSTLLSMAQPRSVLGVDASAGFVEHARTAIVDERARFETGDAGVLPCEDASFGVVVSALAYNFFPDRPAALREMRRVARPGATIAFYVWDYPGGGMGFITSFWKAAVTLDPEAKALTEGVRFPFCTAETLLSEVQAAGLADVHVRAIDAQARFKDFDDFFRPFTLGAGPAPGYYTSLDAEQQQALRAKLEADLGKGEIVLPTRAWALRGTNLAG